MCRTVWVGRHCRRTTCVSALVQKGLRPTVLARAHKRLTRALRRAGENDVLDQTLGYDVVRATDPLDRIESVVEAFAPTVAVVQAGLQIECARRLIALGIPTTIYVRDVEFDRLSAPFFTHPLLRYFCRTRRLPRKPSGTPSGSNATWSHRSCDANHMRPNLDGRTSSLLTRYGKRVSPPLSPSRVTYLIAIFSSSIVGRSHDVSDASCRLRFSRAAKRHMALSNTRHARRIAGHALVLAALPRADGTKPGVASPRKHIAPGSPSSRPTLVVCRNQSARAASSSIQTPAFANGKTPSNSCGTIWARTRAMSRRREPFPNGRRSTRTTLRRRCSQSSSRSKTALPLPGDRPVQCRSAHERRGPHGLDDLIACRDIERGLDGSGGEYFAVARPRHRTDELEREVQPASDDRRGLRAWWRVSPMRCSCIGGRSAARSPGCARPGLARDHHGSGRGAIASWTSATRTWSSPFCCRISRSGSVSSAASSFPDASAAGISASA